MAKKKIDTDSLLTAQQNQKKIADLQKAQAEKMKLILTPEQYELMESRNRKQSPGIILNKKH